MSSFMSQQIKHQYRALAARHVAPNVAACRAAGELDTAGWRALADHGLWKIAVPRGRGGAGGTWPELAAAIEGLAAGTGDLGFVLSVIAHAGLVRAISEMGTDDQRRRYLPRLLDGAIGATAITELAGGSDVARISTTARASARGWTLSGEKAHITNAPVADLALVVGRIPELGTRDITLFLVDLHRAGVTRGAAEAMTGNRTSPTGTLRFDSVTVGRGDVLGRPGDGLRTLYDIISLDRMLYGAAAAGTLDALLLDAMSFAHRRHAFRAPIAQHQYVQQRLTDIKVAAETSRSVARAALDLLVAAAPEAQLMCSLAKLVAAEALCRGTQDAMVVFGHAGYEEGPVSWAVRDALGTLIAGGTPEMQRKNIFNQLVGLLGIESPPLVKAAS